MTDRMVQPIQIIQGGQYGSEAKGAIASHLCSTERVDVAVRTGATNAGHTVVYRGVAHKMQQMPVGWTNPDTRLVIGAGSLVDLSILRREIQEVSAVLGEDIRRRLRVDHRATIHRQIHQERSAKSGRHQRVGATGKGCSEVLIDKLRNRGLEPMILSALSPSELSDIPLEDTVHYLNIAWEDGAKIQLEGTQGTLLDLHLGPYPYATHKQTQPSVWLAEAGLSPALPLDIVMVARTFPIRVAGNSGPLPSETSWPGLARQINAQLIEQDRNPLLKWDAIFEFEERILEASVGFKLPPGSDGNDQHLWSDTDRVIYAEALSNLNAAAWARLTDESRAELSRLFELTTVTKKLRRIAFMSTADLRFAAQLVRPHRVVLTFMNYLFPENWWSTDPITTEEMFFVENISRITSSRVSHINRGPFPEHILEVPEHVYGSSIHHRIHQSRQRSS